MEAEAVQRLGKLGRAQGALVAMRRNVLRERLAGEVAARGRPAGTVVG